MNFLHIARVLCQAMHRGGGGLRRRAWPLRGLAAALAVAQAWAGRSSVPVLWMKQHETKMKRISHIICPRMHLPILKQFGIEPPCMDRSVAAISGATSGSISALFLKLLSDLGGQPDLAFNYPACPELDLSNLRPELDLSNLRIGELDLISVVIGIVIGLLLGTVIETAQLLRQSWRIWGYRVVLYHCFMLVEEYCLSSK